ncbi:MAG: GNAT family N-acetyltransferase [Candidatus Omnitrophica bacterium]|nr:GNAT family N-acetyltransferase [Candidatus Omnitrophota bacterium]
MAGPGQINSMVKGNNIKNFTKACFLVTGGAGFIGSHAVDRLLSLGHDVIVVDNLSTGRLENIDQRVVFYKADISDMGILKKIFGCHKIDYVLHEAAKINLNVKLEDPAADIASSVIGTINLLKSCLDFKVKKIVYASSVAVYGRPKLLPAKESDEPVPVYSYGVAKKCAEEYIRYYSDNFGIDYTILRYANIYGPRQPIFGEVGVIAIFADRIAKGLPLTIFGDGMHLRDYIYIDDAVEATITAFNAGSGQTFNVGCGEGVSVMDVFEAFCQARGKKPVFESRPERVGELGKFYSDTKKITEAFNFRPRVKLKEGISRTLSFCLKEGGQAARRDIALRPVEAKDKDMIFGWRNTPFLIGLGGSGRAVTRQEHSAWFDGILKDQEAGFFIINYKDIPAGQVRFELSAKGHYIVSIYLLEKYTGMGIGPAALLDGIRVMRGKKPDGVFIAVMKKDNRASVSLFSKCGFYEFPYEDRPSGYLAMRYDGACQACEEPVAKALSCKASGVKALVDFYDDNIKQHGSDIGSVAWGSKASQEKRFEILSLIADLNGKSVLDLGCGLGDLYGWMKEADIKADYTGMDISLSMIERARQKYPKGEFIHGGIGDIPAGLFYDYILCSGIFNRRVPEHERYVSDTITAMFDACRLGIGFNMMSVKADFFNQQEYYAQAGDTLDFCLKLSRRAVLRHDYMGHDFTVYVYKNNKA